MDTNGGKNDMKRQQRRKKMKRRKEKYSRIDFKYEEMYKIKEKDAAFFDPDPFCFFVVSLYALRFIAIYCIIDEIL